MSDNEGEPPQDDGQELPEDDEMAQLLVRVPRAHKELAKAKTEHGEISEVVRRVIRNIALDGELNERAEIEREIQRVDEEIAEREARIEKERGEIEDLQVLREELHASFDRRQSRRDAYLEALKELEAEIRRGEHRIFAGDDPYRPLEKAANLAGVDPETALDELRQRNPDLPPWTFEVGRVGDSLPLGVPQDLVELPIEEREPHPEREDI